MTEYKNYQMYRVDGRNQFMEVMSSMIDKGKIVINFIQYDDSKPVGQRQGRKITTYLDLDDAKNFFHQAAIGGFNDEVKKKREAQRKGGYKYAQPVFQSLGGTTAEVLKKRGEERKDKKAEARVFELTPGDRQPWIIQAKVGGGNLQPNGLISMAGRPDYYLMVGMSDFDFRKMGTVVSDQIRLIETKLMLGGDCAVDTTINLNGGSDLDKIKEDIVEIQKTQTRILNGLKAIYNNTK